jgi:hypothetical protein
MLAGAVKGGDPLICTVFFDMKYNGNRITLNIQIALPGACHILCARCKKQKNQGTKTACFSKECIHIFLWYIYFDPNHEDNYLRPANI